MVQGGRRGQALRPRRGALTYEPPLAGDAKLDFVRQEKAGRRDLVRCWLQKEPARKLANLASIPVVIVWRRRRTTPPTTTAPRLSAAGRRANTLIRLADVGVRGNGHMMMIEKNNARSPA